MPIDISRFQQDRKRFIEKVREGFTQEIKDIALNFHFGIFEDGPLLKGQSSASWNASVNIPNQFAYDDTFFDPTPGRYFLTHRDVDTFTIGDTIWVSNHVHYINLIESNSSRAGWIARNIRELGSRLKRVGAVR